MLLTDPTLILLGLAAVVNLVLIAAAVRSAAVRRSAARSAEHLDPDQKPSSRGVEIQATPLLTGYLLAALAWTAAQGLYHLQTLALVRGFDTYALQRIGLYLLLGMAVLFLQLTRQFLRRGAPGQARPDRTVWIAGALAILVTALLYENPLHLPASALPIQGQGLGLAPAAFDVFLAVWAVCLGWALALTLRSQWVTRSPLHRNRIAYWVVAVSLAAAGQALVLVHADFVGNLIHLGAVSLPAFVLLTYNLPDLRTALRRSAASLIMLLITVVVYTGGFLGIQFLAQRITGYQAWVAGAVLALALAALFNPLLGLGQRFIRRWFSGARYDPREMLGEYSQRVSHLLDLNALSAVVVGLIRETMEITHGALVTVSREVSPELGEVFALRFSGGTDEGLPAGCLTEKNPALATLRHEHRPVTQYDIDLLPRYQGMEPNERDWFNDLKMDVFVPIFAQEKLIGLLALGPKQSGDRYFDEDLAFLQTLADQTAVALENARLFEGLKQRNAENERLNRKLQNANAELARLDQAKTDFINIASHELRTPLTQIMGYNEILTDMFQTEDIQPGMGAQMVESVHKAAKRLEEIVETMFDVSKLDTRTLEIMRAPVTLRALVADAIQGWAKGIEDRRLVVTVTGLDELPPIFADSQRLSKVFAQLVQNAIKSTPDGGEIHITGRVVVEPEVAFAAAAAARPVSARATADTIPASTYWAAKQRPGKHLTDLAPHTAPVTGNGNGRAQWGGQPAGSPGSEPGPSASQAVEPATDPGYIEVVVKDTGIGIARDDLERIFEKFYRVGSSLLHSTGDTKFKGAGPGLGLTIARGIVEAHGGRMWAESPGHDESNCPGSAFHVLLPIRTRIPH